MDNQIFCRYATDDAGALFGDYIGEVTVESFKKDFAKATYYSVLTDGNTDASIIEEEAIYVLFLDDSIPKTKYFSIENVKHGNAEGLHDAIKTEFERFGIENFEKSIVGLNCDGANVNMGISNGLGKLGNSQTDSQALKRSELEGHSKKWKDAMYPMYMAIYLDILSPIRRISSGITQSRESH